MIDQDEVEDTVATVKDTTETSEKKISRARQRWSIMYLARTADTESINTAKKEKMQVCTILTKFFKGLFTLQN